MVDRLKTLYAAKAIATQRDQEREPFAVVDAQALARMGERRSFRGALSKPDGIACIAEIKQASPSLGKIVMDFDPAAIAAAYEAGGADAISVLTEESGFFGDIRNLDLARAASRAPILRKDFLTCEYEIAQAAAYGADAALLIVAGLRDDALHELLGVCRRYQLDALVEVHTEDELARALASDAEIIGINNRDLRTFTVDLETTVRLAAQIPAGRLIVSESGIHSAADVGRVRAAGANAVLIGEALMRSRNISADLRALREAA